MRELLRRWLVPWRNRLLAARPDREARALRRLRVEALPAGRPVLFYSPFYWPIHLAWETVLREAVHRAGYPTVVLGCAGFFPRCDAMVYGKDPEATCRTCRFFHARFHREAGLPPPERPDRFVPAAALRQEAEAAVAAVPDEALPTFTYRGLPLGAWVRASLWRHLRSAPWEEPHLARAFLQGAVMAVHLHTAVLDRLRPARVVLLNGKFFAHRILLELCRRRGIPVVTYERGPRRDTLLFGADRPAVPARLEALWAAVRDRPLSTAQRAGLAAYLQRRPQLGNGQVAFLPRPVAEAETIRRRLRLDGRPVDLLCTNLVWDSAVTDEDLAFPSMLAWLEAAVAAAARRPDRLLVIRVHPAEVRVWWQKTRLSALTFLRRTFPRLPANVRVVPPTSRLSTYTLMDLAQVGLVYTSTAGLELALRGKPVIVAGRAPYRGLGFTLDVPDPPTFHAWMDRREALLPPPETQVLAERFAYLYYFVAAVPVPWVEEGRRGRFRVHPAARGSWRELARWLGLEATRAGAGA